MSKKISLLLLTSIFMAASVSGIIAAETKAAPKKKMSKKEEAAAKAAMDAKMAEMMKVTTPNENHKVLEAFVGNWTHTAKFWMEPGADAQESKGTSTSKWIMGGRYLQTEAKGDMMGMPFEGMGLMGYDTMKGSYQGLWLDNMTTGMMTSTAQYDAAAKTLNEMGSFSCPMTGDKNMAFRAVWRMIDADHYSYEMFEKKPDGSEFRGMEIQYSRVK